MRIAIAEIWAHNIPNTKRVKIEMIKEGCNYYYITNSGDKGYCCNSLAKAKADVQELWGNWIDFKMLIKYENEETRI